LETVKRAFRDIKTVGSPPLWKTLELSSFSQRASHSHRLSLAGAPYGTERRRCLGLFSLSQNPSSCSLPPLFPARPAAELPPSGTITMDRLG